MKTRMNPSEVVNWLTLTDGELLAVRPA